MRVYLNTKVLEKRDLLDQKSKLLDCKGTKKKKKSLAKGIALKKTWMLGVFRRDDKIFAFLLKRLDKSIFDIKTEKRTSYIITIVLYNKKRIK